MKRTLRKINSRTKYYLDYISRLETNSVVWQLNYTQTLRDSKYRSEHHSYVKCELSKRVLLNFKKSYFYISKFASACNMALNNLSR